MTRPPVLIPYHDLKAKGVSYSPGSPSGTAMGSDLNIGHLAREDAESRAQGRAAGMAAFLRFVGRSG
jgi:hypothetical protein